MDITNREKQILNAIKHNPQIAQKDLSKKLGITRSAVAGHIMNLTNKGYIKGRAYIFGDQSFITVIGGANIDIHGKSLGKIKAKDSNPGKLITSPGGVARNIAENISRLGIPCRLVSVIGNDAYGHMLKEHCEGIGIDTQYLMQSDEMSTSTYMSIIDNSGDMRMAISDMKIVSTLSVAYIKSIKKMIDQSKIIVLDTNIEDSTLKYIVNTFPKIPIFIDTVSSIKAKKVLPYLANIHTLKPNLMEAEAISGIKAKNENELCMMADWFHKKGLKRLFVTLGQQGIFFSANKKQGIEQLPKLNQKYKNETGAGDATMAGLVFSWKQQYSLKETVRNGLIAAHAALTDDKTITTTMSIETHKKIYNHQYG
ncbi:MAG: PfkB family carbohydrate kinase [Pseudomonadota bacterium]|nr:PfkB family carbohydrate kinase [Pseudomonadota bacterium]